MGFDFNKRSVLHHAAFGGNREIMMAVFKEGFKLGFTAKDMINAKDQYGFTPKMVAETKGHSDIFKVALAIALSSLEKSKSPSIVPGLKFFPPPAASSNIIHGEQHVVAPIPVNLPSDDSKKQEDNLQGAKYVQ